MTAKRMLAALAAFVVTLALAAVFLAFAVGLSYYLRHLNRFLGR